MRTWSSISSGRLRRPLAPDCSRASLKDCIVAVPMSRPTSATRSSTSVPAVDPVVSRLVDSTEQEHEGSAGNLAGGDGMVTRQVARLRGFEQEDQVNKRTMSSVLYATQSWQGPIQLETSTQFSVRTVHRGASSPCPCCSGTVP